MKKKSFIKKFVTTFSAILFAALIGVSSFTNSVGAPEQKQEQQTNRY